MNGFWGKILEVDLSKMDYEVKGIDESIMRKFLGGVGLAAYYLYNEVPKNTDPLGDNNLLIISPGLLVSSGIPTASKTTFVSKSPLTGAFGRAVAGASIGPEIKKAGYDGYGHSQCKIYGQIRKNKNN